MFGKLLLLAFTSSIAAQINCSDDQLNTLNDLNQEVLDKTTSCTSASSASSLKSCFCTQDLFNTYTQLLAILPVCFNQDVVTPSQEAFDALKQACAGISFTTPAITVNTSPSSQGAGGGASSSRAVASSVTRIQSGASQAVSRATGTSTGAARASSTAATAANTSGGTTAAASAATTPATTSAGAASDATKVYVSAGWLALLSFLL